MKGLHSIAFILLIVGGLNWLLIALFDWGIGNIFAVDSIITKVIYILVGLSAIVEIINHKSLCKKCDKGGMAMSSGN
ncbi:MAG TPA: DUF378 domain-containing protein [Candidatus Paceibacterota bacterium]